MSQWILGMDVPTAVTVATSAAAIVGAPAAAWAAQSSAAQRQGERATDTATQSRPALAGPGQEVAWNIPTRSLAFTGRHDMLVTLRQRLAEKGPVVILALHGMGGVGKTSLASEYAHRFAEDYRIAWWINAEDPEFIEAQLADLGVRAGWVVATTDAPVAAREVLRRLRGLTGWLVIFDNVDAPDTVTRFLPHGPGHVLVTSRNPNWRQLATPLEVDTFARNESIALLRRLAPAVGGAEADRIAEEVGDLPLAVAQAAGVLSETAMAAPDYLDELKLHAGVVMTEGRPVSYPASLAATVTLAMDRLSAEDAAAAQLIRLCAPLAPVPVPIWLFTTPVGAALPPPLGPATGSTMAIRRIMGHASRYGLAKVSEVGPQLHRLTKAIIVDEMGDDGRAEAGAAIERLLAAAAPGDSRDPANWPMWAQFLPHLIAVDPAGSDDPALRQAACHASWYVLERGDLQTGHDLADRLYQNWRHRLGADDRDTLHAAHALATAYVRLGRHEAALALFADTFTRRKRIHGEEHPDTLVSAVSTAWELHRAGRHESAYALNEATLSRLKLVHGEDRKLTLGAAHNLAIMLGELGRVDEAVELDQETFIRRRRALGHDHPHTILSMLTLSVSLHRVGRTTEAIKLCDEALSRSQHVLGDDHFTTMDATARLADLLHQAGDTRRALALREDTLGRRLAILGRTHPHTVESARDLAESWRALGKAKKAEAIESEYLSG